MKNNKGITLIALVVTIIVLLILAGVAIAMLTGNNSILQRAKSGVGYNYIAGARDEVALAYNAAFADYMRQKYDDGVASKPTLAKLFSDELVKVTASAAAPTDKTSYDTAIATSNTHNCVLTYTADNVSTVVVTYIDDQGNKYQTTATLHSDAGYEKLTWNNISETAIAAPGA